MMDLLESNFERQERFVSDASMSSKTPLTIIESYASLLQRRGKERPEVFDEAVEGYPSESVRMREMTEQLLLLAKQPEQWNVQLERVDITRLATDSTRAFREAYHREVRCEDPGSIWAISDESKLKQLLFILLDNARKYSEDAIEVRLEAKDKSAVFELWIPGLVCGRTSWRRYLTDSTGLIRPEHALRCKWFRSGIVTCQRACRGSWSTDRTDQHRG